MIKDDITGMVFGKWTAIEFAGKNKAGKYCWICVCECGFTKVISKTCLKSGRANACRSCSKKTHGMSKTAEFRSWDAMIQRCTNENHTSYKKYGGAGITVCEKWMVFQNFIDDMGKKPSKSHSIDRIDNKKGYSPDNCRWATPVEQANNTKRNVLSSRHGELMTVSEIARETGDYYNTVYYRIVKSKGKRGVYLED